MAEYDDPAGRAEARRVKKACDGLLKAMRRHEAWPESIANPDIDRLPTFRAIAHRSSSPYGSPADMCAEIA
jgi:hypothetical protein